MPPRWQRKLVPFLKRAFPKATFVVTTHSPLVVRECAPGEAYELRRAGDHVTARNLGSPRDWYFSDVLSDAFQVELPAPGTEAEGMPTLVDQLLEFSRLVHDHAATQDAAKRFRAVELHDLLLPRLPEDDPRRHSIAEMRALLG